MPEVTLKLDAAMTLDQYRALLRPNNGYWWIGKKCSQGLEFHVGISRRKLPAIYPLCVTLDLKPGIYIVGGGTFRKTFRVE